MFWGIFNKKEKIEEKKEMISVINENGKEISIEKEKWIEEFLKPNLEKNKYNNEYLYNLILVALNYKIYAEVMPYSLMLLKNEGNSKRAVDLLMIIYYNSNAFSDIIAFGDILIGDDDVEKTSRFYYYYATSFKKLSYFEDYEKYILVGLSKYPNNKNLIEEFIEILNSKEKIERDELILALKDLEGAYKLNLIFARMIYAEGDFMLANELAKNALIYSKFNIEVIKEVSNLLFSYNQHLEFENLILPKFDIRVRNLEFIDLVLKYYIMMYKYLEGLQLLKNIRDIKIINSENISNYLEYEKEFLKQKFLKENKFEYENLYSNEVVGNYTYLNISKPLNYYFLSKNEEVFESKEKTENIAFISIAIDEKLKETSNDLKDYLHILPITILEKSYETSNINLQIIYRKDDIYIKDSYSNYSMNFFRNIAKMNKNLDKVLTGYFTEKENGEKFIQIYGYDCREDKVFRVIDTIHIENNKPYSLNRILNKMNEKFNLGIVDKIDLDDEDIKLILDKFKVFFNVDKNNKYRRLFFENKLNYYLSKTSNKKDLIEVLSILSLMKKANIEIESSYLNRIYGLDINLNENKELKKIVEEIFDKGER